MELDVAQLVLLAPGEGETVNERSEHTIRILFSHELLDVTWSAIRSRGAWRHAARPP